MDSLGPVNLIGLALFGAAFLWTIHLVFASQRPRGYNQNLVLMTVAGWVLIFFGVGGTLAAGILTFPLIALFLVFAALAVDRYRVCERKILLWAMAVAIEKGYPLSPAVRAFADERSDELGRRAHELADLLDSGVSLPVALEMSGHPLPTGAMLAASLHSDAGGFAAALREAARDDQEDEAFWQTLMIKSFYLFLVVAVGMTLFSGLMVFVFPTFIEIAKDFEVELPPITQFTLSMIRQAPWVASLIAIPQLVFVVVFCLGLLQYIGWLDLEWPIASWILRRVDSSHILQAIALGIEAGRPLDDTLELIARCYPRVGVRSLLRAARDEIVAGGDWCAALEHAGLIDGSESALFRAAERAGNLPWALREAASGGLRRLMLRLNFAVTIGMPVLLLIVSVPIAICIIGVFMPLVTLLHNLSQ